MDPTDSTWGWEKKTGKGGDLITRGLVVEASILGEENFENVMWDFDKKNLLQS